tara:strand:+ start:178 stop:648 length:471 start_codon:yes stop_codon:yes gene_type:complete
MASNSYNLRSKTKKDNSLSENSKKTDSSNTQPKINIECCAFDECIINLKTDCAKKTNYLDELKFRFNFDEKTMIYLKKIIKEIEDIVKNIRNVTKYTLTSYTQSREVNDYTTKIKYSLECYLKELGNYLEDFYTYNSSWTTMEADATLLLFKLGVM